MAINDHIGKDPGPWSDIESLGYTLLYLYGGPLPWMGRGLSQSPIQGLKQKSKFEKYTKKDSEIFVRFCLHTRKIAKKENAQAPDYDDLVRRLDGI